MKFFNAVKTKGIILLATIVVLIIGLVIGVRLSKQEVKQPKATVGQGAASLSFFLPEAVNVGEVLPVIMNVNAPETLDSNSTDGVVAVAGVFTFDNTMLQLTESDITYSLSAPWSYIKQVTINGNTTTVDVEAVYFATGTDGYVGAASSGVNFASFSFVALKPGSGSLTWDVSRSVVLARTTAGEDTPNVLGSALAAGNYVINSPSSPTVAPTVAPTSGTNPNPTATLTPTPNSGGGSTNACGGTCGSHSNCNAGLFCYAGFCRNPSCQTQASCVCPNPTAVRQPTAVPTRVPTNASPTAYPTTTTGITPTSDNPFLGGTPRVNDVQIPDITYQDTPVESKSFFDSILARIISFFNNLFGFR